MNFVYAQLEPEAVEIAVARLNNRRMNLRGPVILHTMNEPVSDLDPPAARNPGVLWSDDPLFQRRRSHHNLSCGTGRVFAMNCIGQHGMNWIGNYIDHFVTMLRGYDVSCKDIRVEARLRDHGEYLAVLRVFGNGRAGLVGVIKLFLGRLLKIKI